MSNEALRVWRSTLHTLSDWPWQLAIDKAQRVVFTVPAYVYCEGKDFRDRQYMATIPNRCFSKLAIACTSYY